MCNQEKPHTCDSDTRISFNLLKLGLEYPLGLELFYVLTGLNNKVFDKLRCISKRIIRQVFPKLYSTENSVLGGKFRFCLC